MNKSPEKINYNAFNDDYVEKEQDYETSGVKKSLASKSRFAKNPQEEKYTSVDFDHKVAELVKNDVELQNLSRDLSTKYKSILMDKTLAKNKSPDNTSFESQLVGQLAQLGLQVNADQSRPEGYGSITIIALLLKCVLIQRDLINQSSYEIREIKRALKQILDVVKEDDEE